MSTFPLGISESMNEDLISATDDHVIPSRNGQSHISCVFLVAEDEYFPLGISESMNEDQVSTTADPATGGFPIPPEASESAADATSSYTGQYSLQGRLSYSRFTTPVHRPVILPECVSVS